MLQEYRQLLEDPFSSVSDAPWKPRSLVFRLSFQDDRDVSSIV